MKPLAWLRRQARWTRIALLLLVPYVIAVLLNLLVRAARHGWRWYPDLLANSLIVSLMVPAAFLISALLERRRSPD